MMDEQRPPAPSPALYQHLFNSIRDVIVVTDFERRILAANQPALRETFGYELEEVVGQSTRLLYDQAADFERAGRHFFSHRGKGERWKAFESIGRRKNGRTFPVEILGIGIRDEKGKIIANLGIVRDITRRQETEMNLRRALDDAQETHDRLAAILKSVNDGMLVTDNQNRIILMNRAAEDFFGLLLDEVREQHLGEVLREKLLLQQHLRVVAGEAEEIILDLEMTDRGRKEVRTIEARTSAVTSSDGQRSGTITILRDVTREREIARLKSEFISLAAHELRTPLSAVMGFSELLISHPDLPREQQLECARHIFAKAEHLDLIVDDLLDLSRLESGRPIHLEKAPFDLRTILENQVAQYRTEAPGHRFTLALPAEPIAVVADANKIVQVLENLLSNAVKYSPGGGEIEVIAGMEEDVCRITVADEGIGMSADQVERVFDKFYRADTSNTAVSGLGLGMNIAKMIIEDHGGQIRVESWPALGTKVTVTLPLAP